MITVRRGFAALEAIVRGNKEASEAAAADKYDIRSQLCNYLYLSKASVREKTFGITFGSSLLVTSTELPTLTNEQLCCQIVSPFASDLGFSYFLNLTVTQRSGVDARRAWVTQGGVRRQKPPRRCTLGNNGQLILGK